ncbi:hypothetical protein ACP6L2_11405 [Sphingobacterium lactis]|uniref:hypothetical protein n=1 Tax=Sphingobacterium lactis TaxID=797291 RepID=UPI003F7F9AB1
MSKETGEKDDETTDKRQQKLDDFQHLWRGNKIAIHNSERSEESFVLPQDLVILYRR